MEATTENKKYKWQTEMVWHPVFNRHVEGKNLECINPDYIEVTNRNGCMYGAFYAYHKDHGWLFNQKMKFKDSGSVIEPKVRTRSKVENVVETLTQLIMIITDDCLEWADWHFVQKASLTKKEVSDIQFDCIELRNNYLKTNNVSHVSNESTQVVSIGKHTPEDKPVVKEVDGLQQIQLFEDTQVKTRRDPDADLFGYKAKDKTDRQRFKRKLAQLQSKLEGLSVLERTALIRGLNAKFTPPL